MTLSCIIILAAVTIYGDHTNRNKAIRGYVDGNMKNLINLHTEYASLLKIYIQADIEMHDNITKRMKKIEDEINRHYQQDHASRGESGDINIFSDPDIQYKYDYTIKLMQIHY